MSPLPFRRTAATAVTAVALLLAGCTGQPDQEDDDAAPPAAADTVTLVTHDSFTLGDDVLERFEQESGLTVEVKTVGDAGALADQLVPPAETPPGDVVLGVDNTFMSRVVDAGATEVNYLWQVGEADVCVNADKAWFTEQHLPVPRTLDDLIDPPYQGLLVVPDPASSSVGLAFLLAAVDEYGDTGVGDYWTGLRANDVEIAGSWDEAYGSGFTGAGGGGDRPLVVSYSTSPADTVEDDGEPVTTALPETCFRHEEYAGLLAGAPNREGGKELLWYLTSDAVQRDLPASMSLYPADEDARLPAAWAEHAPRVEDPHELDPEDIAENREAWIEAWAATTSE
ncbi:thiamine ABC transporter substrate-binding protein [Myceligenerans salitolerans]|uniref:Thiamine ABC transporter substrate-binding protein n=1 Tax=Myceligenerans salitolerans TaxID=1230528 RepID=A0ABS3I6Y6_9MICO|nr:thiamine ABC transporter substrate-binding protein [Myceligenerans salitolerans]MBO0608766.1 thiamine ABC transporter substrate-binding protein [Myceligenerans salitolerans]